MRTLGLSGSMENLSTSRAQAKKTKAFTIGVLGITIYINESPESINVQPIVGEEVVKTPKQKLEEEKTAEL